MFTYFFCAPDDIYTKIASGESSGFKWLMISITGISLIAYSIRAVSKIMFSSYHLARDAEEREQLTHVYLALIKEDAADQKDRSIILQALFSRADTGLLKDVSSPTMPGIAIDKLISK